MRVLGLDYGDRTVGVAVSDPFGWTAQGLTVIRRQEPAAYKATIKEIAAIVTEMGVTKIVLGFPKNLDNTESERCALTRVFAERLEKRFPDIPVILWDERLSTVAANRRMMEGELSAAKRKQIIDKMAAVHILQGYLDASARQKES